MYHVDLLELWVRDTIPTVYESGMSLVEVTSKILEKVNELITTSNNYFSVDPQTYLVSILAGWEADGTLETLINETTQSQIADEIAARELAVSGEQTAREEAIAALDDKLLIYAVTPEKFTGTDVQKIQAALDYALDNNYIVVFPKMYDISGQGSLSINKADGSWDTDRRVLYLIGLGGGIRKDDGGIMFTAPIHKIGDINVQNMKYQGVPNSGMKIWNCDKLIRIMSSNNEYIGVDTIATATTEYMQSCIWSNEHITGGMNFPFEFKISYDCVFDKCLFEGTQHVMRNTAELAQILNFNLRIKDCLIEGVTSYPIRLGSCRCVSFVDNYFEANGLAADSQIDLKTLGDIYYQFGVTLIGNRFTDTAAQTAAGTPAILHGRFVAYDGVCGCTSINNISDGALHRLPITAGSMIGIGDIGSPVNNVDSEAAKARYLPLFPSPIVEGTYNQIHQWGAINRQSVSTASTSFTAGEVKQIDMVTDIPPLAGDPVSFSLTNSANFQVLSSEYITNAMRVHVKNTAGTSQSTVITMSVLKLLNG